MSTSFGDRATSPWLMGFRVTIWAWKKGFSIALQLRASSSAETIDSLVGTMSRISPLEAELMLIASLSADDRSSSSEV